MTKPKTKPKIKTDPRWAALVILVDNTVHVCRLVPDEQDAIVERSFNALYALGFTPDEVTRALKALEFPPVSNIDVQAERL